MKYSFLQLLLIFLPFLADAQMDTAIASNDAPISVCTASTKVLKVLNVTEQYLRVELSPPLNSVATTLSQNTLAQIKTYGTPTLATLSLRGLGSQHCAILWNGFNAQQSMHGTSDVSLLGLGSASQNINLNYGASCARDGGGSIAGSMDINAKPIFGNGLNISIYNSLGSFGYRQQMIYAGYKSIMGYVQMDYLNEHAKNDFKYLKNGNPAEKYIRLKNAQTEINQFNFNTSLFFKRDHNLKAGINYTDAYRQIPVTEFQSINASFQKDKQFKSFVSYEVYKKKVTYYSGVAYFYDQLDYSDPLSALYATSKVHKLIGKFKMNVSIAKNHNLLFVMENNYAIAATKQYKENHHTQNFFSLTAAYTYRSASDKLYANLQIRQQLNDRELAPFIFEAVLNYKALKSLSMQVKGGRVFKVPTLNDLYWNPGGNKNLLSEKGWNAEYLIRNYFSKNNFSITNSLTNFYYLINNWIVWLPTNQGYWAPQNIKKVFSRGLQDELALTYKNKNLSISFVAGYQFNLSTQVGSFQLNDQANKKQLIYEPLHKVKAGFSITYHKFVIQYTHQYTSKRFTSSDNVHSIPGFHTANLLLTKSFNFQHFEFVMNIGIDNLFNSRYYMVESRPMPGRNYKIGIIIKCNTQFNK